MNAFTILEEGGQLSSLGKRERIINDVLESQDRNRLLIYSKCTPCCVRNRALFARCIRYSWVSFLERRMWKFETGRVKLSLCEKETRAKADRLRLWSIVVRPPRPAHVTFARGLDVTPCTRCWYTHDTSLLHFVYIMKIYGHLNRLSQQSKSSDPIVTFWT